MGMAKRHKKQSYLKTAFKKMHKNHDKTVEAKDCYQNQKFMYFTAGNKFLKKPVCEAWPSPELTF